ncbi:hypothetical protein BT93_A0467 [Corymbia citriodora subsp. variegata]|nr:hypothetical protein BT93_A0467 [Corymbia citriodora subsp. variegata]
MGKKCLSTFEPCGAYTGIIENKIRVMTRKMLTRRELSKRIESNIPIFNMEDIEEGVEGYGDERSLLMFPKA